jgi:hypothetical protein
MIPRNGAFFCGARLVFSRPSQYFDLRDPTLTRDELVSAIEALLQRTQSSIYITAVRSDHHDDSALGLPPLYIGTHAHGWAIDCWPMPAPAGSFYNGDSLAFASWLRAVASVPGVKQVGLAGSADTVDNRDALGSLYFPDMGADHVHIGVAP